MAVDRCDYDIKHRVDLGTLSWEPTGRNGWMKNTGQEVSWEVKNLIFRWQRMNALSLSGKANTSGILTWERDFQLQKSAIAILPKWVIVWFFWWHITQDDGASPSSSISCFRSHVLLFLVSSSMLNALRLKASFSSSPSLNLLPLQWKKLITLWPTSGCELTYNII